MQTYNFGCKAFSKRIGACLFVFVAARTDARTHNGVQWAVYASHDSATGTDTPLLTRAPIAFVRPLYTALRYAGKGVR